MKTLPIQKIQTRGEQDIFLKEGGGSNELPDWATKEMILEHAGRMNAAFASVELLFDERDNDELPLLMVAYLDENATGRKSFRANVRAVFDNRDKRNVLGKESHRGLLVKVESKEDLRQMAQSVGSVQSGRASKDKTFGVAVVDDLQLFRPYMEEGIEGCDLKVRLVDYHDERLNAIADQMMLHYGEAQHVDVHKLNYADGLRLYSVKGADAGAVVALATMDAVISVRKMPYIELTVSPEEYNTQIEVKNRREGETYPRVGLLDSGVEPIPHLEPWLDGEEQNIANLDAADIRHRHGTSVAGIINYGDELQGQPWTRTVPSLITSCVVNTEEDAMQISEDEMVEHVKTAIAANSEVKVWNLSQGSTIEIEEDEFSDFAVTLDSIQKTSQVLICKSAGNIRREAPDQVRLAQGADSVMSLVVGSIAHEKVDPDDVEYGCRSPFSRIGLGPYGITKPDLTHYGGNTVTGIYTFSEVGYQTNIFKGTSHSTPRVTALASNLAFRLGEPFNPILVKALLIHSASYPNLVAVDNDTLRKEQGFGLPATIDDILYNDENEFTMIWQPTFNGTDFQIQDIPFPTEMVDADGYYRGELTVTVVTEPVFRNGEHGEYCQSDVEVLLQTYDETSYYVLGAAGTPRTYRNPDRLVGQENVLTKGRYSQRSFDIEEAEKRTIIWGEPYQPVKKYHINLQQMTPKQKEKCLKAGRHWGMSIKATYRDATMADKEAGVVTEEVRAVILLTLRDTEHSGLVYDRCMRQLEERNFAHNDVVVRQRVNVGE